MVLTPPDTPSLMTDSGLEKGSLVITRLVGNRRLAVLDYLLQFSQELLVL